MNARNLVPAMLTLVREREDRVPRGRRDNGAALPASPRKGDDLSVAGARAADNDGKVRRPIGITEPWAERERKRIETGRPAHDTPGNISKADRTKEKGS